MSDSELIPAERVESAILVVRGHKVLLDSDLAALYGVTVKRLNEQVKRNSCRFPQDFVFQLTSDEWNSLRSQSATFGHGSGRHRKYLPFAFTEHGALMASSVLSSQRAVEMSILVVRAFVKLRGILAAHRELVAKLDELERRLSVHDRQFASLFDAIRRLMAPGDRTGRPIGFGRGDR